MAAPLLIAAASAGTALQVYGTWKAHKDQAALLRRKSFFDRKQAEEVLARNDINNELLWRDGQRLLGDQAAQFAASGRAASATTFDIMAESINEIANEVSRNNRAASWEAAMINAGADSRMFNAGQIDRAGKISAAAQALSGAANIADKSPGLGIGPARSSQRPNPAPGTSRIDTTTSRPAGQGIG